MEQRFSGRRLLILLIIVTSLVALGIICYFLLKDKTHSDSGNSACSNIPDLEKFDCYPDSPVTESECVKRGCCYRPLLASQTSKDKSFPPLGTPYCFYPSDYVGYKLDNITWTDDQCRANLSRVTPSGFPNDVKNLLFVLSFIDDNTLRIKITDSDSERFEVPIKLQFETKKVQNPLYDVNLTSDGSLTVKRKSSEISVFNSNLSHIVFADQFLEISSRLQSPYFYGLGEHKDGILKNVNWTRFTLFNRDGRPAANRNLYGTHPFYIVLEKDGSASGVFLYNSNAMDAILQPTPAVTLRPIGGILDLFIMLGPSPKDVVQQYTNIVGRTFMPPYWSFGFQLCKYGYWTLNNTKKVWQRTIDAGIPYDVQWNDIDYMEKNMDFTYDKVKYDGLPDFVNELHEKGMHYVVMIDPGVSNSEEPNTYPPYDEGVAKDLFVKNTTGSYFEGKVWNTGSTVFPDFSNPSTRDYWKNQFERFHSDIPIDGAWIDMNEPASFYNGQVDGCPESPLEDPPYLPGGVYPLRTMTVCMTARHFLTVHYNEHNLLCYREAEATNYALREIRKKRPFIISRATFSGQGLYSGHWSGDISSNWEDMRYTIPSMLNFNMYGISMVGSDICGFVGNTTEELCARWQTLGAFYPFSRNHNDKDTVDQDPAALGPVVTSATINALTSRYYLLPYLYTLFYRSHVFGETVARPLFFEYPTDAKTYNIDEQFLWGPALMIMPALYPGVESIDAYFPKGIWYDFHSGENKTSAGQNYALAAPLTTINLAVRGGYILPLQLTGVTTTESRKKNFDVFVALDEEKNAIGELYWDDGDSLDTYEKGIYNLIEFSSNMNSLNTTVVRNDYDTKMDMNVFKVYGLDKSPEQITINDQPALFEFTLNCLTIVAEGFSLRSPISVIWS